MLQKSAGVFYTQKQQEVVTEGEVRYGILYSVYNKHHLQIADDDEVLAHEIY